MALNQGYQSRAKGVLLVTCVVFCVGCEKREPTQEGEEVSASEHHGMYEITSFMENTASCDTEGLQPVTGGPASDTVVLLYTPSSYGYMQLISCPDEATCQERLDGELGSAWFIADLSDGYSGAIGFGGSVDEEGMCQGTVEFFTLTVSEQGELRVEKASTKPRFPPDEEGRCWTNDAFDAADAEACVALEVIEATLMRHIE